MTYTEASASVKVGVFSVVVTGEATQRMTSMKEYKAYQELCERYTQLLINTLNQTGTFEVVRLHHDYEEMSRKKITTN
jgi:curli biogenesis system outer membrane secretion channel CsgG